MSLASISSFIILSSLLSPFVNILDILVNTLSYCCPNEEVSDASDGLISSSKKATASNKLFFILGEENSSANFI